MRLTAAECLIVLTVLATPPGAAQEPPEPPAAVGDVHVALSVEPAGGPTPPDGTRSEATLSVQVTCEEPVVMTAPIEIDLAFTGSPNARNVSFDPAPLLFESERPACAGSTTTLTSVVSFELWPPERYGTGVDMAVEATSEHVAEAAGVAWVETMGFVGDVNAVASPVVPVKTNANNEVAIRLENEANEDVAYRATVQEGFGLAQEVAYLGFGVVPTRYAGDQDGVDHLVLAFVPEREGDAALAVHFEFEDPRPGGGILKEQVVSMTISSSPDNDPAVAPRPGNGAPGPGAVFVVLAVTAAAAAWRRAASD